MVAPDLPRFNDDGYGSTSTICQDNDLSRPCKLHVITYSDIGHIIFIQILLIQTIMLRVTHFYHMVLVSVCSWLHLSDLAIHDMAHSIPSYSWR